MSLSLVFTAGVLAAAATVVWRTWVRALPSEQGLVELLETARRQLDTPFTFRPLQPSDAPWADVLNAAMLPNADLPPACIQIGDIVYAHGERIAGAIRAFVPSDGRWVLFMTAIEDVPPLVGFASYAAEGRYLTVRAERWPSKSPVSRVRHVAADASISELLDAHVDHVAAEELVAVSNTDEFVQQLQRIERLELEWRRAQPEDALLEHDLRVLFGDRYDEVRGLLHHAPSSHIPRATAASLRRAARRRSF